MILFCQSCNKNHQFSAKKVERIVYTLVGMFADQTTEERREGDPFDAMPCLKRVYGESTDCEGYSEFVAGCFESRAHSLRNPHETPYQERMRLQREATDAR